MPLVDLPIEQLRKYKPQLTKKKDFGKFWDNTLKEARKFPLNAKLVKHQTRLKYVEAYDLTYSGFAGHRIKGWYLFPKFVKKEKMPTVVMYHGYGGGRGLAEEYCPWLMMGCAVAVMDTRGQAGETGNMLTHSNPSGPGWMTKGILDKNEYYYRAVYTDAVRMLDFVFSRPETDKKRVALNGGSQGGGITIAAAGLDNRAAIAIPEIPFLCNFKRAVEIAGAYPFLEISDFLKRYPRDFDKVYDTLSYFDGMNLASQIKANTLWSVGLWDVICPPSTIFSAYNQVKPKKEIIVQPYAGHESMQDFQLAKIKFVAENFKI